MRNNATKAFQYCSPALLCVATVATAATFAGSMPADWPDLKPGMMSLETVVSGKPNPKLSVCITQADKDASLKAADEFMRSRKECEKPVYTKRGSTFVSDQHCKPVGEAAYTEHAESTALAANQVRTKSYRLVNGKETMVMETTHTRTGDCTGKEAPQAGSLEAMIEKAKAEAATHKGKRH